MKARKALRLTHGALNDLLAQVLVRDPSIRDTLIYDRCLLQLASNREVFNAPLSGNFYEEAEAVYRYAKGKGKAS